MRSITMHMKKKQLHWLGSGKCGHLVQYSTQQTRSRKGYTLGCKF